MPRMADLLDVRNAIDQPMDIDKRERLFKAEALSFFRMGLHLKAIRGNAEWKQLHDDDGAQVYRTFEDYCRERLGMSRPRIYQFIEAGDAVLNVYNCRQSPPILPATESQARPLTLLDADVQAVAWQEVIETAPKRVDGTPYVVAKHVDTVVKRLLARGVESDTVTGPTCTVKDLQRLIDQGLKFGTIYADPPWSYGNQATRAATDNHYDTMDVPAICELPVAELAADQSHLHLWTTNAFLFEAKTVMEAWGFDYKSVFVWCKPQMGIGNYWRVSHEFMLLGVRGGLTFADRSQMSWATIDRGKHSAKPEAVRQRIELVSPGPYLEMFARRASDGWCAWGNEVSIDLLTQHATEV